MIKTYKEQKEKMERNNNRGYLYGRLFAMYEIAEKELMGNQYISKSETVWDKVAIKPEETMFALEKYFKAAKIKERLMQKSLDLYKAYDHEMQDIKDRIVNYHGLTKENGEDNPDYGQPIDGDYVFGYEAEKLLWSLGCADNQDALKL